MKSFRFVLLGYKFAATTNALSASRGCSCRLMRYNSTVAEAIPSTWQLHSAVCLQRHPVITTELNELEKNYKNYLNEVEIDQSLLSDHELQIISDRLRKEKKKTESNINLVQDTLLTAEEMEDEWQKELDQYAFADRITDADRNNDATSPDRKLDKKLVLITKRKFDEDCKPVWIFPQVLRLEGESMREAAERAIKSQCGETVQATYIGNAPCGYHKYNLPPGQDSKGVKLFFFKANYHGGDVAIQSEDVLEYKWVSLNELPEYFNPTYMDDVKDFLIDI